MSNIQGNNPRPNGPDNTWKQVQANLNRITKERDRARGGMKGRTVGNPVPLRSDPPIRLRSGGTQK